MNAENAGPAGGASQSPSAQPPTPQPGQRSVPVALAVFGGVAALVLVIGGAVWLANRDDETISTATTETRVPATTTETVPPTVAPTAPTAPTPTTVPPETSPPTTGAATTTPPTTQAEPPPTTSPSGPTGDTWTITSPYFPDDPFTFTRVAQTAGLSAYDGAIDIAPDGLRCIVIAAEGVSGWSEFCAEADRPANFVVLDGIDPWLIEVGSDPGDVTLNRRDPTWVLPTNGCLEPMTTLVAATPGGGSIGSAVATAIVCVPGEAFVSIGAVMLQPGPADGGGALLALGDEGWATIDFGTSIGCEARDDGVDRCALYGVESELFEALLPIPESDALTDSTDLISLADETATVLGWIGGAELTTERLDDLIVDEVTDPDAEVSPTVTRSSGGGFGQSLNLLVIEIPAMDDSVLSTTWAAWMTTASPATVVRAYSWSTCARGLAGPDICI